MIEGYWDKDDIRRVFVAGAKWWEFESRGATMWNSDVRKAETEATRRYASQQAEPETEIDFNMRSGKHCHEISLRKE